MTPPRMRMSEARERLTPRGALALLLAGNRRFAAGEAAKRDLRREVEATAAGRRPLAVVLGCMDSRVPPEPIFDLGIGDLFAVRIAGNIATDEAIGSIEYACVVAGARLVLVLGHTRCGAVSAAIEVATAGDRAALPPGCERLPSVVRPIVEAVNREMGTEAAPPVADDGIVRRVASRNVRSAVRAIPERSPAIRRLVAEGRLMLAGAIYDVETGRVECLD